MTEPINVTEAELKQFLERYEELEAEKKDISDQQKELKAEIKGRGYDTGVFLAIVAMRKKDPDDLANFEAVLDTYRRAVGV